MENERKKMYRQEAVNCKELLKGFDKLNNSQQAINDLSNMVLELTNDLEPPSEGKTVESTRPINIKIFVAQNISKGLAEFIKDDEIQEFYEELIVDAVLHFIDLQSQPLEADIERLTTEVVDLKQRLWEVHNKAVQQVTEFIKDWYGKERASEGKDFYTELEKLKL